MAKFKPKDSKAAYQVFAHAIKNGMKTYGSKAAEKSGRSRGSCGDALKSLFEYGLMEKNREGNTVWYKTDTEKIKEYFNELWEEESDYVPEISDGLLKEYIEIYVRDNYSSTIKKMLVEDFFIAFQLLHEQEQLPEYLDQEYLRLDEYYVGPSSPSKHLKLALEETEDRQDH